MVVAGCKRATTIATILLLVVLMATTPPAQSLSSADTLARWQALQPGVQDSIELQLGAHENYATYYFQLQPGDSIGVAVAFIEVKNIFGDLVCRGTASHHLGLLSVNRQCPDLQPERTYVMTWTTDRSGNELVLSGSGPQ